MQRIPDPADRYIKIDGARYCYRQTGRGPGIVLVHGFGESSKVFWREFISSFEDRYTIVAIDLLGHGDSDKPKQGYQPSVQARVIACLIGDLGLEKPVLLGHSLGGIVATRFSINFPDRLSKLIIYDSPITRGFPRNLALVAKMPIKGVALIGILFIPFIGKLLFKNRTIETTRLVADSLHPNVGASRYTDEMIQV
jgi:pimeloyl-ACP methyl ester carboxylesterase